MLSGNICSAIQQGHFYVVVESTASLPAPDLEGPPPIAVNGGGKDEPRVWRVFGSLLGGFLIKRIVTLVKKIPHHCSVSDINNNTNGS